jgi:hypothetical protein
VRRRSVAECSSLGVAEELASSSQLLHFPLGVEVRRSAVLRTKGWGCCVVAVVVAAMMLLVRVGVGRVQWVSVWNRCLGGRSVAVVRLVGLGGLDLRVVLEVLRCCCCYRCQSLERTRRLVRVC